MKQNRSRREGRCAKEKWGEGEGDRGWCRGNRGRREEGEGGRWEEGKGEGAKNGTRMTRPNDEHYEGFCEACSPLEILGR